MIESDDSVKNLRERQYEFARKSIFDAAFKLFKSKGFEETTVDDIAKAAGTSRRTYFRYFKTKEDVILSHIVDIGKLAITFLSNRPADEKPIISLRFAIQSAVEEAMKTSLETLERLVRKTPSLRAAWLLHFDVLNNQFSDVIKQRYPYLDNTDAQILTRILISFADMVFASWISDAKVDLAAYIDDLLTRLIKLCNV
jgi:AcrR family transcriptional regulator